MNKPHLLKLGLMALLGYFIFLIATIPAHIVVNQLEAPKSVRLGAVTGTVWSGQFNAILFDGILLKNVRWSFAPSALLTGKLAIDYKISNHRRLTHVSATGRAYYGFSGFGITDSDINIPAGLVGKRIGHSYIESVTGTLAFDIAEFQPAAPYCDKLTGLVKWQDASVVAMNTEFLPGQIKADLACVEKGIKATIKGDDQTLTLMVDVLVPKPGQVNLQGQVKAGEMASETLANSLSFLGQADAEGLYPIAFKNF